MNGHGRVLYEMIKRKLYLQFSSVSTEYQQYVQRVALLSPQPRLASPLTKRPILLQFGAGLTPLMIGIAYGDKKLTRVFCAHFLG